MGAQQRDSWWMGAEPAESLLQGIVSVPMSLFVRAILPTTIVFLFLFFLLYRAELGTSQAGLLAEEASVLNRGVRRVERELTIANGDLSFVADLASKAINDGNPKRMAAFEQTLLSFTRRRSGYSRIQFIDASGQETVCIENTADGTRITPGKELQNKGGSDFFRATMDLGPGGLSASPAMPESERGDSAEQEEPIVLLGMPVEDAKGQRRGIVTLAVLSRSLMSPFETETGELGVQRMVVNSDGYWARNQSEDTGGFEIERGRTFQRSFPEVWPQLLESPRGRVESSEGIFFFDTLAPNPVASQASAGPNETPVYVFISLVPRRLLDAIAVDVATPLLMIATPIYFVILIVGCLMASSIHRRRVTNDALRNLVKVRSAMTTAALEGIVVMDDTGVTVEFNRSATRIFGYTQEEARGKLVADLIIPPMYRERHRQGLEHYLATGEGPIIDKHVDDLAGIRKNGEEFPLELTVCPVMLAGRRFFYGFLRDLSESGRKEVTAAAQDTSN
ncbi:MAG: PAS domain S-box protein [bacterium]|nr:PAS domain S-box protein [bacterium]